MAKYIYPAIFRKEDGKYLVNFPDVKGCHTFGDNLEEAYAMAEDALALMMFDAEVEKREAPKASDLNEIKTDENEFVSYVMCDTLEYNKKNNNKAIKKTLSIPCWLNTQAEAAHINFSATLQEALKTKLNIL